MCWNHRAIRNTWELERERWTPVARSSDHVRVSDADRDEVVTQLSRHTGEGRLTLDEFETRVEEVYASKTRADLHRALRELPVGRAERRPSRSHHRHFRFAIFLAVIALVAVAPAALWWLIPCAFFTIGRPHHHHHSGPRDAPAPDELISV